VSLAKSFEELRIWQEARVLVVDVYSVFGKGTPAQRDLEFRTQAQAAVLSAMSNIAEGFERKTRVEFARFLDIAKASAGELRSLLYVAEDLGYLNSENAEALRNKTATLSRGIAALTRSLRKRAAF